MAYDTLLATLGLLSLASTSTPTTYNPTAVRAGVAIAPAALPSTPTIGSLAIDSGAGNDLKWWNGTSWQSAGGSTVADANEIVFGTGTGVTTDNSLTYNPTTGVFSNAISISPGSSATAGYFDNFLFAASTHTTNMIGVSGRVSQGGGGTNNGLMFGVESVVSTIGGVAIFSGVQVSELLNGTATATAGYGVNVTLNIDTGYTVGTYYGLYLGVSGLGTITSRYGIYQADAASTNHLEGILNLASGVVITPAALPGSPAAGRIAIDSGAGNALKWWNGSAWQTAGGGSGSPAGSNTEIQFNNSGSFGASSNLTWDGSSFSVTGSLNVVGAGTARGRIDVAVATTTLTGRGNTALAYGIVNIISERGDAGSLVNILSGTYNRLDVNVPAYFYADSAGTARTGLTIFPAALPLSPDTGGIAVDSSDNNILKWWNGTSWQSAGGGGGGGPAGSNTELQYNNSGSFGASPNLSWDGSLRVQTSVGLFSVLGIPATLAFYQTSGADYASININDSTNELEFRASNATILLLSLPTSTSGFVQSYCDVALSSDKAYYIGDPNTDDSWRMIIVGTDLAFQRRELGVWNTKQTIFA